VTPEAEIVVLCSTQNDAVEAIQRDLLASFLATTPDRCRILFLENSSTPEQHGRWKEHVETSGQRFAFSDSGFAMNRLYNEGTALTSAEFVMYANSDLIFYEDWYENLLSWFERLDNLFVAAPFSCVPEGHQGHARGPWRHDGEQRDEFLDTAHLPGWFTCFRRSSGWVWDEAFEAHYQDNDFARTLREMRRADGSLRSGVAYNSRVDHLIGGTHRNVSVDYKNAEGAEAMRQKWGDA
jgi:GT2 family glycosyltransferase